MQSIAKVHDQIPLLLYIFLMNKLCHMT